MLLFFIFFLFRKAGKVRMLHQGEASDLKQVRLGIPACGRQGFSDAFSGFIPFAEKQFPKDMDKSLENLKRILESDTLQ